MGSMRDAVHSVRAWSIRGQDYSVGITLFWGLYGQKRRLCGACVVLEAGALSVRSMRDVVHAGCGPFG
jgi:hypothetical protein